MHLIWPWLFAMLAITRINAHELVDIRSFNPNIIVDLRYATYGNFFGKPLYPFYNIFVDEYVAKRLGRVQRDLAKEGFGLVIYEGYRPPSVQAMIDACKCCCCQEKYKNEAPHYRKGLGVDVSLFYLDGQPMCVPCQYDEISPCSYRDYPFVSANAYHNVHLLETVMTRYGFAPMREKWWHYDLKGWEEAPDLCIEYNELCCCGN
jgi:D-alanyl-D-alanine dipeptidase